FYVLCDPRALHSFPTRRSSDLFFLGRYPTRTNIYQAIGPNDLAISQVSPYDMTTPKLLKQANYESAMFGKFHLAGPENNEAVNRSEEHTSELQSRENLVCRLLL